MGTGPPGGTAGLGMEYGGWRLVCTVSSEPSEGPDGTIYAPALPITKN